MVRHFPVLHFPDPAIPCEVVCQFPVLHFQVVHFQSPQLEMNVVTSVLIVTSNNVQDFMKATDGHSATLLHSKNYLISVRLFPL